MLSRTQIAVIMQGLLTQKIVHKKDFISAVHRGHDAFPQKKTSAVNGASRGAEKQDPSPNALSNGTDSKIQMSYCYRYVPFFLS